MTEDRKSLKAAMLESIRQEALQSPGPPKADPPEKKSHTGMHWSLAAMAGGQAADVASTIQALQRPGVVETNPILGKRPNAGQLIGLKAAGLVPLGILLDKAHDKHPKLAKAIALGVGGYGAYLAARNHQKGRR